MTKNKGKLKISKGGTKGGVQWSLRYHSNKLNAFLSSYVNFGIVFHYYRNEILSFPDNPGKNEGSEMYSFPELVGKVYIFFPRVGGKGINFFIPIPVSL